MSDDYADDYGDDEDDKGVKRSAREKAARRQKDLENYFLPRVRHVFAADKSLTSALLVVGQYYSDNAYDEVHAEIVFSSQSAPRWPHFCNYGRYRTGVDPDDADAEEQNGGELCTRCARSQPLAADGYFSWPYEEEAFRAWEPFCHEGANQEQDTAEAYTPFAIARRSSTAGSSSEAQIEVEHLNSPVRAWLDVPDEAAAAVEPSFAQPQPHDAVFDNPDDLALRSVVADVLLERDEKDPRAEYLSLVFAPHNNNNTQAPEVNARAQLLFEEHHRTWLGDLARVTPSHASAFEHGFPSRIDAYFPDDHSLTWVAESRDFCTVKELHFLPRSLQPLREPMRHVRKLGPLTNHGIADLAVLCEELDRAGTTPLTLESLHVAPSKLEVLETLLSTTARLPHLKTLTISGLVATQIEPLLAFLCMTPLYQQINALYLSPYVGFDATRAIEPTQLEAVLAHPSRELRECGVGPLDDSGRPGGLWFYLRGRAAHISMPRLGSPFGMTRLVDALAELPIDLRRTHFGNRVSLVTSSCFHPLESDLRHFKRAGIEAVVVIQS